ncbi:MAG TPA: hypothetical protein VIN59_06190 [Alphaproteobacteria bacterium]
MAIAEDLDGTYAVTSITSYNGPLQKQSDGITVIEQGRTNRTDEAGCEWRSSFVWVDDDHVRMTSIADPTNARADFMLTDAGGRPTMEPQIYESILTVKRKDDRIQMTGTIDYGHETIFLTMKKMPS